MRVYNNKKTVYFFYSLNNGITTQLYSVRHGIKQPERTKDWKELKKQSFNFTVGWTVNKSDIDIFPGPDPVPFAKPVYFETKPFLSGHLTVVRNFAQFIAAVRISKQHSQNWLGMRKTARGTYVHKSITDHCTKMRSCKGLKAAHNETKGKLIN